MKNYTKLISFAKHLRNNLTDAEKLLWYRLKSKQLNNLKFRRQTPIGPYSIDFVCFPIKLVIELDGSQHAEKKNKIKDQYRDAWLKKQGFKVLRFWDNDVLLNIEGVLEKIYKCCLRTPSPNPSHQGRGN